jgi:hypothetical protein
MAAKLMPTTTAIPFVEIRWKKRGPKPCGSSWHAGPMRTDPDALFQDTGECACCSLLIHRSQVRVPA